MCTFKLFPSRKSKIPGQIFILFFRSQTIQYLQHPQLKLPIPLSFPHFLRKQKLKKKMNIPRYWMMMRMIKWQVTHVPLPGPNQPQGVHDHGQPNHPNHRVHQLEDWLYAAPYHPAHAFSLPTSQIHQNNLQGTLNWKLEPRNYARRRVCGNRMIVIWFGFDEFKVSEFYAFQGGFVLQLPTSMKIVIFIIIKPSIIYIYIKTSHLSTSGCCGVVVITSVLHTEGPQFDPGQHHYLFA